MASNVVPMPPCPPQHWDPCDCDCESPRPPGPWFPPPQAQPPWYPGANGGISFGLTAPPNPVRGHLWWNGTVLQLFDGAAWVDIVTSAVTGGGTGGGVSGGAVISPTPPGTPTSGMQWWNGTILQIWDGTAWKTIGPGAAAGPVPTTTRVFSLTQAAAIGALTANTWTIVPFNATPTIDTEGGWNASTRQYKPTKAGIYQFLCRWPTGDVALPKNDTGTFSGNEMWVAITTTTGATGWQGITGLTAMNGTTDFVRMYALATTAYTFPGSAAMPLFEAWLMA